RAPADGTGRGTGLEMDVATRQATRCVDGRAARDDRPTRRDGHIAPDGVAARGDPDGPRERHGARGAQGEEATLPGGALAAEVTVGDDVAVLRTEAGRPAGHTGRA